MITQLNLVGYNKDDIKRMSKFSIESLQEFHTFPVIHTSDVNDTCKHIEQVNLSSSSSSSIHSPQHEIKALPMQQENGIVSWNNGDSEAEVLSEYDKKEESISSNLNIEPLTVENGVPNVSSSDIGHRIHNSRQSRPSRQSRSSRQSCPSRQNRPSRTSRPSRPSRPSRQSRQSRQSRPSRHSRHSRPSPTSHHSRHSFTSRQSLISPSVSKCHVLSSNSVLPYSSEKQTSNDNPHDMDEETVVYAPHISKNANIHTQLTTRLNYLKLSKKTILEKRQNLQTMLANYQNIMDHDDENVLLSELDTIKEHVLCVEKEINQCNCNLRQYLRVKSQMYQQILNEKVSPFVTDHVKQKIRSIQEEMTD